MADWRNAFLQRIGAKPTPQNLRLLTEWQRREGGHTNNTASFNWLNTTRGKQYPSINSVGVRAFPDFDTGVQYLADTLQSGRYPNLVRGFRGGNPYAQPGVENDLSTWVSGSPTGRLDYSQKVLGSRGRPLPPQKNVPKPVRSAEKAGIDVSGWKENQAARAQSLIDFAMDYATTGEVSSNAVAKLTGATARLGTVEPPVRQNKKTRQVEIPSAPKAKGDINRVLASAHSQVGKPYVFGSGPNTDSFDCSDLVQWAYKQIGVDIPRVTWDQIKVGKPVKWGQFQPGDLIFSNGGGHVTMYVGNGKVIAAPYTGTVVQYQPVSRFKKSFVTAKRIL